MRTTIKVFVIISILSQSCFVNKRQSSVVATVYKIDSIKSFYLIYAATDSVKYKIVSKKQNEEKCRNIIVNGSYAFNLHSTSKVNGQSVIPSASAYEVFGLSVDETTIVDFERETQWDLFAAENIRGLCYKGR